MRRKLNVKLLAYVGGVFVVAGICVHFLHGYQTRNNAHRLLERADRAVSDKEYDKALSYYANYLTLSPNDVDTVQKFVEVLDQRAVNGGDRVRVVLKMDQVLRAKPDQHELRFRLVQNLILLDRIPEAIAQLRILRTQTYDQAEVLHILGWCQEIQKDFGQAIQSLEEAIKLKPAQIKSYTILAEIYQDRLTQPEEAAKVMDAMVRANGDSYQTYLFRARFQRRLGNDKAAEGDLEAAYRLGSDHPEVILEMADVARAKGNWAEATRLLQEGLTRFPDKAGFYQQMAWVKLQTDRPEEAIAHLQDGTRNAPRSNELAVLLVDLLIDQKRYDEARAKVDDLLKAGLTTLPNYLKARLCVADGQWSESIRLLEGVRKDLAPGSDWLGRVHSLLGLSYRQLGDHEQALMAFRRAVQADPTWLNASLGLATALIDVGRMDEALDLLEPMRSGKNLPASYWRLLTQTRLHRQMRTPVADRRWEEVDAALARLDPKSLEFAMMTAEVQAAREEYEEARTTLEKAKTEHSQSVAVWIALADLALRQGRVGEAEKWLSEAPFGDRLEVRLAQARLWARRRNADDREKLLKLAEAPFTSDQRAPIWRELAEIWHSQGEWDRAEMLWQKVADALPKDVGSRLALLDMALQKNQLTPARGLRDQLREIEGADGRYWRYGDAAILVHESRGRRSMLEDARRRLNEVDRLHKNWTRVSVLLGTIDELEGHYPQAIQQYMLALERGDTQARVLARLLELLVERREYSKAETELAKHESKLPMTKAISRLGAEIALGMADPQYAKLAVKRAEAAITLPARDYRDALLLARVYRAAKETAKAEAIFEQALKDTPQVPDVCLAWLDYLAGSGQAERGLKELDRLKSALPKSLVQVTIARAYEALRMPEKADAVYQEAFRADTGFLELTYGADFYRRADRDDEARQWYTRLLEPELAAPLEYTVPARRFLAVLLADGEPSRARTLMDDNKRLQGDTLADYRVRLFLQSHTRSMQDEAIAKFEDTFIQMPPTPEERLMYARMLESAGRHGQVRAQLAAAVAEAPTARHLLSYARALIRINDLDEAALQISRAAELEPGSARVQNVRAALEQARKATR